MELGTRRPDPLNVGVELPLRGVYHPVGFRLEIATNSSEVLAAAGEAWGDAAPEFDRDPLRLRVAVSSKGALAGPGRHAKHGHLYSIVSDSANFAHADLSSRMAFVHVSQATALDHRWFRWFFLEAVAYSMLAQRDVVMIHGACVARQGRGVLLCGPTTAGKSTLSYACARAGWTWLSDDCTCVLPGAAERTAIARSAVARFRADAPRLFPELEPYAVRARPTGKLGIEVPMDEVPGIRTARRATIAKVVFLDRGPGPASLAPVDREEAIETLLGDMPRYGPEADAIHERVIVAVAQAPAFRMRYNSLADGVSLLGDQ